MSGPNPFQRFWDLGYRSLISIIPAKGPAAGYAAKSASYLGKAPGYFDEAAGLWRGRRNWQHYEATKTDLVRWFEQGANVGLRLEDLLAIDIDASDPATAGKVEQMALAALGPSPCRIGRAPRRMLLYRLSAPMRYTTISFDHAGENEKIEFSTGKRQMVVHGIHAKTGRLYDWTREIVARDELTVVAPEQVEALVSDLRAVLPPSVLSVEGSGTDRAKVNQEALRGPAEHVRAAIEALPNNSDIYPTRDDYIRVGVALKAALEDDNEAFELWCDWSAKYDDGGQPELWSKDWRGIKPPYEIGAGWLYDQARKVAGWTGTGNAIAAAAFADTDMFGEKPDAPRTDIYRLLSIADILSRETPKFLIDRHVPEQSVGFLYGDPGTGKSFIALDWALHLAYGKPAWHGDDIEPNASAVVYLAGEGVSGYKTRIAAWLAQHPEVRGDDRFRLMDESANLLSNEDGSKLVRTLRSIGGPISMIVVDTVSRAIAGAEENSTKEMSVFVEACTRLSRAFNCAVVGIHHTNKTGGMRGSTTFPGGADFVFKLERKKGSNIGWLFCEKQKDAPDGWGDNYKFDVVCTGVSDKGKVVSSWVPTRCTDEAMVEASSRQDNMLEALDKAWKDGRPWSNDYRSGSRHALRIMHQRFGIDAEDARSVINSWLRSGTVYEDIVSANSKQKGLRMRHTFDENEAENGQGVFG